MLRTRDHKLIRYHHGEEVLFDLRDPQLEVRNLAGDPAYAAALAAMNRRLVGRLIEASQSPRDAMFRY
ncbi:MAG: hypothetical protein AAGK14_08660 [Verrucomicrobiota bacterium]